MKKYWELSIQLPNSETHAVVNEFLLHLKLANRSPLTIESYRSFLERFFGNMDKPYSKLTSDDILEWIQNNQQHVKEKSLTLRISTLNSFFHFCVQEEYIERSPMKSRWFPRLPKPIPKYLEKKEIAKTRQQSEKVSLRDQLLFEFMLTSGCRVAEVEALNIKDINLEQRTARVIGKGRKIREVHFSEKCAILMERYLEEHPNTSEALFLNFYGERLKRRRIQQIISELGEKGNLTSSLYPHRLRHTFATELVTKGVDISFISEELGHDDISVTQIYARIPNQELILMYRKYMG